MPWTFETIHPLFVHFPIALFSTGLFFDIFSRIFYKEELEHAGFWTMFMGLISCVFTNITGLIVFLEDSSLSDIFQFYHGIIVWISILLLLALFIIRIKFQLDLIYSNSKSNLYLFCHILAVSLLFAASHLGAKTAGRL